MDLSSLALPSTLRTTFPTHPLVLSLPLTTFVMSEVISRAWSLSPSPLPPLSLSLFLSHSHSLAVRSRVWASFGLINERLRELSRLAIRREAWREDR